MYKHEELLREQWKYLIILDACRFDDFCGLKSIDGETIKADSQATHTAGWYKKHWSGDHPDTVLVSANPHPFYKNSDYACRNFYESITAWDNEVSPANTISFFNDAKKKYPNKRIVLHFMPPHLPFIGDKGKELLKTIGVASITGPRIYRKLRNYGQQNGWDKLRECYRDNLSTVMSIIKKNIGTFPKGKTVITADHAELIGEEDYYGHPSHCSPQLTEILRTVPWTRI